MTSSDKIYNPSLYSTSDFSTSPTSSSSKSPNVAEIISKGRDHGIATYSQWRKECGGGELKTYEDLIDLIDSNILKSLRDLYPDVSQSVTY